jgi:hypothetical protein
MYNMVYLLIKHNLDKFNKSYKYNAIYINYK